MAASGRLWGSARGRKRAVQATCSVTALMKQLPKEKNITTHLQQRLIRPVDEVISVGVSKVR